MNHKNKTNASTEDAAAAGAGLIYALQATVWGLAATGLGGCYPDRPGEAAPSSAPPPSTAAATDYGGHQPRRL